MKLLIVLLSLNLTLYVQAETKKLSSEEEISSLKKRVAELEKERENDNSSRNLRKDKSYFGTIGLSNKFGMPGYNLAAGIFIDEKIVTYLNYYRGKYSSAYSREKSEAIGLGAQFFTGNSFYLRSEFNYHDRFDNGIGDPSYEEINALVAIGNQWQWKYLSIGVDWIGASYHLVELKKSYVDPFTFSSNSEIDKIQFTALNLSIGLSF